MLDITPNKNSGNPFFSLITVCFNAEKTISRTFNSVKNQTFQNFEYIIIDGQSSDNTISIIKEFEPSFSKGFRLIIEKDKGIYDAMNKGIKIAKGKLVGIINSDDWYEPDALEKVFNVAIKNPDSIIYGLMRYYRNGKEFQIQSFNHEFLHEIMINHPTCFVPKKIYEDIGLFDLKYRLAADYDFFIRCKKSGITFLSLPNAIANMTMEGASLKNFYHSRKETYDIQLKHNYISYIHRIARLVEIKLKLGVKFLLRIK